MKNLTVKIILLVAYLITLSAVLQLSHIAGGFISLLVLGSLGYCGIIVAAHTVFHCYRLCRGLSPQQPEQFSAAALVVESDVH